MATHRPSAGSGGQVESTTSGRWLLLALQLPAHPSNARVKTWRRLQQLGALALKGSVYVLPNTPQAQEDFEWLRIEIESLKGQAHVFTASAAGGIDDEQLIEQFRALRGADYQVFLEDSRKARSQLTRMDADKRRRTVEALELRLQTIRAIDFFPADAAGRAEREFLALARSLAPDSRARSRRADEATHARTEYQQRTWVTRVRPGVDRLSSAWLISRFIDRQPTFVFASDPGDRPDAVAFDMFGGGFAHEGDQCTFEVLQRRFCIADPKVSMVAQIVHDLDLKEERFRRPEAPGVAALVDGLRLAATSDDELVAHGIVLFEAIYRGLRPGDPVPDRRSRVVRIPRRGK